MLNNKISIFFAALAFSPAISSIAYSVESENTLPIILVTESPSFSDINQLPLTTESVTRKQATETINVTNSEDMVKYLPSILVRKRFIGDTDAPLASRTTGINASARSLIYADGVLLSALINNNNGNGSPRWFMVSPEEIERVDVMYGPYAAAYAGNSYGAVVEISTRMPNQLEAGVKATSSWQDFDQYGTHKTYNSTQAAAVIGNRVNDFSFWLSANHLDSESQPVTYGTLTQSTNGTIGGLSVVGGNYADQNRTGGAIQVLGAGNLTHTIQDNGKLKLAYDVTSQLQAAYSFGIWQNQTDLFAQTYLTDASGNPYYGASSGNVNIDGYSYSASAIAGLFNAGTRDLEHYMHSFSVKTKDESQFDWDIALSMYDYAKHQERTSVTGTGYTYPAALSGGAGRILDMKGTGWITADAKGILHQDGQTGGHVTSFGTHLDRYTLVSPTYNTSNWINGDNGAIYTDARGKTETSALWAQEVWRFDPQLKATVGARYEQWRAFDGYNATATSSLNQAQRSEQLVSPKLGLAWAASEAWIITGSMGQATRFPTVGELYQTATVASVLQNPNPDLKPEKITSAELAFERGTESGRVRISLFEEHVSDNLISQFNSASNSNTVQNVDKTRQRGIELVLQQHDVLVRGLEFNGSLTYVDAVIEQNDSYVSINGSTSVGKQTPYIPALRATLMGNYRPEACWTYTLAARYSDKVWATVDNTDINGHTYQGFEGYFVVDARVRYQVDNNWSAAGGVDNLNNRAYYLFHPFPQRTWFAELKYDY